MAETPTGTQTRILPRILEAAQLGQEAKSLTRMFSDRFVAAREDVTQEERLLTGLAAMLCNLDESAERIEKGKVLEVVRQIDQTVNDQLNEILHHPVFQDLEATWRGINGLVETTNFESNIQIALLDASKEELHQDFDSNSTDVFAGALFSKVYKTEYDQYGGKPYGCLLGIYEFDTSPADLFWLRNMSKVAAAAHAPFLTSVKPQFFGCKDIEEVEAIRDLEGVFSQPKFGQWMALRDTPEAAYVGLAFPRYVIRLPWNPETNPSPGLQFVEVTRGQRQNYLWGNSALLLARNLIRSFEQSGWCQYIRGPGGGGHIAGLPVDTFNVRGESEVRIPIEMYIPDYRELEFTRCGIASLVHRKGTAEAVFFSVPAIKLPKEYRDPKDTENSQLVTNLAYTFSVSRIAHYFKSIVRDNIGDNSDDKSLKEQLTSWLSRYVTTAVTPNDVTMRRFPFKACAVKVDAVPGRIGFYDCKVSILPHIQFEGMDIELKLESRLG